MATVSRIVEDVPASFLATSAIIEKAISLLQPGSVVVDSSSVQQALSLLRPFMSTSQFAGSVSEIPSILTSARLALKRMNSVALDVLGVSTLTSKEATESAARTGLSNWNLNDGVALGASSLDAGVVLSMRKIASLVAPIPVGLPPFTAESAERISQTPNQRMRDDLGDLAPFAPTSNTTQAWRKVAPIVSDTNAQHFDGASPQVVLYRKGSTAYSGVRDRHGGFDFITVYRDNAGAARSPTTDSAKVFTIAGSGFYLCKFNVRVCAAVIYERKCADTAAETLTAVGSVFPPNNPIRLIVSKDGAIPVVGSSYKVLNVATERVYEFSFVVETTAASTDIYYTLDYVDAGAATATALDGALYISTDVEIYRNVQTMSGMTMIGSGVNPTKFTALVDSQMDLLDLLRVSSVGYKHPFLSYAVQYLQRMATATGLSHASNPAITTEDATPVMYEMCDLHWWFEDHGTKAQLVKMDLYSSFYAVYLQMVAVARLRTSGLPSL
jgi:hypothetical protein